MVNVFDNSSEENWVYEDTRQPVKDNKDRDCGKCGLPNTPEGHDGCLGTIPGATNACCGHGDPTQAYVQFPDRNVRGEEAVALLGPGGTGGIL